MMGQALHWMPKLKVENIGEIGCIFITHCYILVLFLSEDTYDETKAS